MKYIILFLIKSYQYLVSPWLGQHCRFLPTCSEYAKEAYETHSVLRATKLTSYRLLRCQPWCQGGHDPVPSPNQHKLYP